MQTKPKACLTGKFRICSRFPQEFSVESFMVVILVAVLLLPSGLSAQHNHGPSAPQFVPNQGQWNAAVQFKAAVPGGALFMEKDGFTWRFYHGDDMQRVHDAKADPHSAPKEGFPLRSHAFKMTFEHASDNPQISGETPFDFHHNYFLGKDRSKWAGKVSVYSAVRYDDLYPGIDLRMYSHEGAMKYDLLVQPGAQAQRVRMNYEGLESISLSYGRLKMTTSVGELIESKPYAYQYIDGQIVEVPCQFRIDGETVFFDFPKRWDNRYELIIDPVLIFGTYSGATSDNWGYTATYDASGHLYGGGISFGTGYPVTLGALQEIWGGGTGGFPCDVAISKYTPDGTGLVWATWLGGNGNDFPHSIIVNDDDELFVYGTTGSPNFPVTPTAYDTSFNGGSLINVTAIDFLFGSDVYVARFSADGSTLLASTYIGGTANDGFNIAPSLWFNYGDHARGEIILDGAGNPIVASSTVSADWPTTGGVLAPGAEGGQDGVLFGMDANLTNLSWSTYLGGSGDDGAYSVKIATGGELLVCGGTSSFNFPTTPGGLNSSYMGGSTDGFVVKLNPGATGLIAGTYIGTADYDQTYLLDKDDDDEVYIVGQTTGGSSYPTTGGIYIDPGSAHYITKLSPNLNSIVYSTVFGNGSSSPSISPTALLVDVCENVYVSGWGGFTNTGWQPMASILSSMPLTADAYQSTTDGSDFYFFVLNKNAISLFYASYFGGTLSREHVDGGTSRFDRDGIVYQAVCAGCGSNDDFPTTTGAWSNTNGSTNCNLGTMKFEFDLSGVFAESQAEPNFIGCVPFTVNFENLSTGAVDYIWNFGDGGSSTDFEPIYTYDSTGVYSVEFIAIDSNSCNIADTVYLTIIVGEDSVFADFDETLIENCDSIIATFANTSTPATDTYYYWDYGDGTTDTTFDGAHVYTVPGDYTVTLVVLDSTTCNFADTVTFPINFGTSFESNFTANWDGCLPVTVDFTNDYLDGDTYVWDFDDGGTGTGLDPSHTYSAAGTYDVMLVTTFCGIDDTSFFSITIPDEPTAFFDNEPSSVIINSPATFTNLSTNALNYLWSFGDGGTSTGTNPTHIYTAEGTFQVCLEADNGFGCTDEYCRLIDVVFDGIVDVPNAFSPNDDGNNDFFIPRGFGVERLDFRIYNRWGEMIYRIEDLGADAWDGTFRGEPQPMDVYTWSMEVRFFNGKKEERSGNVSLLR